MLHKGHEYADNVAEYILQEYGSRGIEVYREVYAGKSIIGKNRRVDILIVHPKMNEAMALECKYQESSGTADEKIPYALDDMKALRMRGCLVYAGNGFSEGVLHMLRGSSYAVYCAPYDEKKESTKELDHVLAMHFKWWDILTKGKKPLVSSKPEQKSLELF